LNKKNGILSIKTIEDFHLFNKKYRIKNKKYTEINYNKVAEDYGGIEIKNYNKINQELRKDKNYYKKYSWFYSYDFSSGCIWNLSLIKELYFFKKLNL
jgi:hypothetical protein